MLFWQGFGGGFTANAWQNLIGKIFPSNQLATFLGAQSALANLLSSIGALIAGAILGVVLFPGNFALCFLVTGLVMMISLVFLSTTRETDHANLHPNLEDHEFWQHVRQVLKHDRRFAWFTISRIAFQFMTMSTAFYTVYAVKHMGMSDAGAATMASILFIVQVGSNFGFGWVADHIGRNSTLMAGAICGMLGTALAFIATQASYFYVVAFFAGIANSAFWTIGITICLEFGSESERPTYVGLANTLIGPTAIIAPLFGGWLADLFDYRMTFLIASLFGILTLITLVVYMKTPHSRQVFRSEKS